MEDYKYAIKLCLRFLEEYRFLSETYIIEFFTNSHWEKIPVSWQNLLSKLSPPEIAENLLCTSDDQRFSEVWPLSLLAFIKCSKILSIPRCHQHGQMHQSASEAFDNNQLKHVFRKHVKPKKQHEIQMLSEVIETIFAEEECTSVIDIGSGQGHLSRLLSLGYHLPVITLEHEMTHLKMAKKFDDEAKLHIRKKEEALGKIWNVKEEQTSPPSHVHYTVPPDVSSPRFMQILEDYDVSGAVNRERYLLTGLHACGDLSATMIRLFKESDRIKALVSVGCCYMKLTTSSDVRPSHSSYPMSGFVGSLSNHHLSYKAREIACHAIEDYRARLMENGAHLKMHCYRAVLECLIRKENPTLIRPGVQTIKKAYLLSFDEYARKAFAKLDLKQVNEALSSPVEVESMLGEWNKVVGCLTLALMLAPVIESVILLDRMVYLAENGIRSELKSIFDPVTSPRCFAIIAKKKHWSRER